MPLSILIKPASGLCNMQCRYCFYCDVAENREIRLYGIMTDSTTDALVRRSFEYADAPVSFAFQGGEPTLAGEDYFRSFIEKVGFYNKSALPVSYSIQTNGYNLSDEMCGIFAEHKFLVGLSLDGTSALHDSARVSRSGEGTFERVNESVKKLKKYNIDFNILTVLTENNAKNISKIYNYFRSRNFRFIQFIKHIDGFGCEAQKSVYSLTQKRLSSFLNTAFGYYYEDIIAGKYISVREFDNFVRLAMGQAAECCGMNGSCPPNLVIEADGGVYPCDFYVLDEYSLGSIIDTPIKELLDSEKSHEFRRRSVKVDEKCKKCRFFRLCRGGCARYREPYGDDGLSLNKYCESYMTFFERNADKIIHLAKLARDGRII